MAFRNYLTKDSYSFIDSIQYSKHLKLLRFKLRIFSDEAKKIELAAKDYEIFGHMNYREIKGTRTFPPENAVFGDAYIIPKNSQPTGEWEGRNGLIAILDEGMNSWCFWGFSPTEKFYASDEDYYFTLDENSERIKITVFDDTRQWDNWFTGELVFSSQSNISKQIYDFLRTFPEFKDVIDA
jgi:hypothetical protein